MYGSASGGAVSSLPRLALALALARAEETAGQAVRQDRCEARLIEEAQRLNHLGKMLAPIIDDAHPMEVPALQRLRLLFEDFPKNHNLILVG